jgi:uncharacterized protein
MKSAMRHAMPRFALLAATLFLPAVAAQAQGFPSTTPARPLGAPTPAASYLQINWDVLTPPGWDAMKGFKGVDMGALEDADPRAAEILKKMREAWDKAPVNIAMVGQAVRIAGYVVPLEDSGGGLKEFLLVPYYGACIHTPPPPSNQIIHVVPRVAARLKTMDTVWISGVLSYQRNDSYMGASSWRIEAVNVQPYAGSGAAVPLR